VGIGPFLGEHFGISANHTSGRGAARRWLFAPALEVTVVIGRLLLVAQDTAGALEQVEEFLAHQPLVRRAAGVQPMVALRGD
jgi:hypothetical protein